MTSESCLLISFWFHQAAEVNLFVILNDYYLYSNALELLFLTGFNSAQKMVRYLIGVHLIFKKIPYCIRDSAFHCKDEKTKVYTKISQNFVSFMELKI